MIEKTCFLGTSLYCYSLHYGESWGYSGPSQRKPNYRHEMGWGFLGNISGTQGRGITYRERAWPAADWRHIEWNGKGPGQTCSLCPHNSLQ